MVTVALVLGVLQACGPAPGNDAGQASAPATPASFYIGDGIQQGGYILTVTGVSERQGVGIEYDFERASEGGVLIAVDYTVKNVSNAPLRAFAQPVLVLLDKDGNKYGSDAGKTGAYRMERPVDAKLFSDFNPGILVHNSVVFEVSQTAFNRAAWVLAIGDANGTRIILMGRPAPSAPPPSVPAEVPPQPVTSPAAVAQQESPPARASSIPNAPATRQAYRVQEPEGVGAESSPAGKRPTVTTPAGCHWAAGLEDKSVSELWCPGPDGRMQRTGQVAAFN